MVFARLQMNSLKNPNYDFTNSKIFFEKSK